MAEVTTPNAKPTQEEINEALALLKRTKEQRAKQREKQKNNPELKAKQAERSLRMRVKNSLLVKKATDAGISVTDKEIDAFIAKNAAK